MTQGLAFLTVITSLNSCLRHRSGVWCWSIHSSIWHEQGCRCFRAARRPQQSHPLHYTEQGKLIHSCVKATTLHKQEFKIAIYSIFDFCYSMTSAVTSCVNWLEYVISMHRLFRGNENYTNSIWWFLIFLILRSEPIGIFLLRCTITYSSQ